MMATPSSIRLLDIFGRFLMNWMIVSEKDFLNFLLDRIGVLSADWEN